MTHTSRHAPRTSRRPLGCPARGPGLGAWIERVAPKLTGPLSATTAVRFADLAEAPEDAPLEAAEGLKTGASRVG